jgi:hypothetical protein
LTAVVDLVTAVAGCADHCCGFILSADLLTATDEILTTVAMYTTHNRHLLPTRQTTHPTFPSLMWLVYRVIQFTWVKLALLKCAS